MLYEFEQKELEYRKSVIDNNFYKLLMIMLNNKDKIKIMPIIKNNKDILNKNSKFITGIEFIIDIDDPNIINALENIEKDYKHIIHEKN